MEEVNSKYLCKGKLLKSSNGRWVEGFYCVMQDTTYAVEEDYGRIAIF